MNKVAITVPNTIRRPRKANRASAYAASASTATTSTALITPASRLLKNHRSTGVCELVDSTVRYACVDTGCGCQDSGSDVASLFVLNDVDAIHSSGAMKIMVRISNPRASRIRLGRMRRVMPTAAARSEEHTSELQSPCNLV